MNNLKPIYSKTIIGYACSCGNKTDFDIRGGTGKARVITCCSCNASKIVSKRNG